MVSCRNGYGLLPRGRVEFKNLKLTWEISRNSRAWLICLKWVPISHASPRYQPIPAPLNSNPAFETFTSISDTSQASSNEPKLQEMNVDKKYPKSSFLSSQESFMKFRKHFQGYSLTSYREHLALHHNSREKQTINSSSSLLWLLDFSPWQRKSHTQQNLKA